ncbi:phospholipid transfer protein C2CD2L-like [Lytechinus variegatus]|uniref:phospholipid transfer protein C2CD2L-like n=1 Tax=Lytechinus variegatus TaxID=7654 RepID=UPI001BB268D9|nr:phospholipid transfer protein C2CD2L-like [Lytechinus variegatus]
MGKEETSFTESLSEDQSTASASNNINGRVVAACDSLVMAVWDFSEALRTGKIDILDVLLIAWLVLATCVFLGFTIYENSKKKEEKLDQKGRKRQGISNGVRGDVFNSAGSSLTHSGLPSAGRDSTDGGDQYEWLNSVVAWLFTQHSQQSPGQIASSWLKALNDESKKHGSSVQVTFDRIKPGSTPPKFQNVQAVAGQKDHLIVTCQLESTGFGFIVFATQQTAASVKLSTCDVSVNRLSGKLKTKVRCQVRGLGEEWHLTANWDRRPDLQLNIKPQKNSNTRQNDGVDLVIVEEILRNAIMAATFNFSLPMRALPRDIITATNAIHTNTARPTYPSMSNNTNRMPQAVHHTPIVPSSTNHVSSKPPAMAETRLLVKVIKANGLLVRSGGSSSSSDPYCIAMLDQPPQRYKTNTIVNTTNPFWDEHFLFQLNNNSRELRFEVWDKGSEKGSDDLFFGEAQVPVDSLEHMRGSRHILPLSGVTGDGETVKGSLTVWFLFMESAEQNTEIKPRQPVSPTKRVETSRSIAPDGTVITMVTTTTAKPKPGERRSGSNEAPMRVVTTAASLPTPQRPGVYPDGEGGMDRSHHSTGTQSLDVPRQRTSSATQTPGPSIIIRETRQESSTPPTERSSRSVADAAIRHLSESADNKQKTPTKKSTLIIHGVSQAKSQPTFLVSKTPNVDLSTLSDEPTESNFKRDASPNRSKRGFKLFRRRSKKEKAMRSVSLDESDLDRARQQAIRSSEGTSTLPLPDHRTNTLEVPSPETHEPISAESSPRRSKRKLFGFLKRQKSKERQYSSQGSLQPKAAKGKAQPVVHRQNLTVPSGQPRSASTDCINDGRTHTGDIGIYGEFELRRPSVDDTESNVSGTSSRADKQQPISTV